MDEAKLQEVQLLAAEIRLTALETLAHFGSGHVGGVMSIVEALAVLYGGQLACNPANPAWPRRDRLVMSKGHAGPALYAALALRGFFPREWLATLNQPGTRLPSHCDGRKTPGVDMSTGSLGQGLSCGVGIALGTRMDGYASHTFVVVGDGEMNEGQNWEAVMSAAHFGLDNLVLLYDRNQKQLDGRTAEIMALEAPGQKLAAFGWHTQSVDGHNVAQIWQAVARAKAEKGRPSAVILNTVKGKGCSFSEPVEKNHHQVFTQAQMDEALCGARAALRAAQQRGEVQI